MKIIDIIILCHNNLELTKKCIKSVAANTSIPYQMSLINNGSTDGTEEYLRGLEKKSTNIEVTTNKENLSFAYANNVAMKHSGAEYFVLLNNDTEVPDGWLQSLIDIAERSKADIVGPLSTAPAQDQHFAKFPIRSGWHTVNRVSFFCTLIKREVIDKIGYLDEQFEVGLCEDDDYCIRAKKAGIDIALDLEVIVYHEHRATIKTIPKIYEIHGQNYRKLVTKHSQSVLVAILHQGQVDTELMFKLFHICRDNRFKIKIKPYGAKPIANNRNLIVKDFLAGNFNYLVMIDSDIVPPENLLDLVMFDKDVIGAVCPQWHEGDMYWVVMDKVQDGYKQVTIASREGLKKVDAIGTGCIVIKRKVLENIRAPFKRQWNEDGIQECGLDFNFCTRIKRKGFEVWAHWNYQCGHRKEIDLRDVYKLIGRVRDENLKSESCKK